jgi:DNA-binding transcriptional MerR regulator
MSNLLDLVQSQTQKPEDGGTPPEDKDKLIDNPEDKQTPEDVNPEDKDKEGQAPEDLDSKDKDKDNPTDDNPENKDTPSDDLDPISVFDQISKITGNKIEGEFDLTVEGLAQREIQSNTNAVNNFIKEIHNSYPDIYDLLAIASNSGDYVSAMKELVAAQSDPLANIEFSDDDIDTQKTIYTHYLKSKGISDKQISALVKMSEDGGTLVEDAKEAYNAYKKNSDTLKQQAIQKQQEAIEAQKASIQRQWKGIEETIKKGVVGGLRIPQPEIPKFVEHLAGELLKDGEGKLFVPLYIEDDNALSTAFFDFRGGKLEDLVSQKALNQIAIKMERTAKKNNDNPKGGKAKTAKTLAELLHGSK